MEHELNMIAKINLGSDLRSFELILSEPFEYPFIKLVDCDDNIITITSFNCLNYHEVYKWVLDKMNGMI